MEYLYFNRSSQTAITRKFVPKHEDIDAVRNDLRLIFEWNTSEAEFDLEFVATDRRVYVFQHSLADNQHFITDEMKTGYSSKEFMIEEVGEGELLVSMTYKGNKKPESTYFKVTIYYNWGKTTQRQEIKVYRLQDQRNKIQLLRLNRQTLVALTKKYNPAANRLSYKLKSFGSLTIFYTFPTGIIVHDHIRQGINSENIFKEFFKKSGFKLPNFKG